MDTCDNPKHTAASHINVHTDSNISYIVSHLHDS